MNAYQESKHAQDEHDNHVRSCHLRGVNPYPANLTTYSMDGKDVSKREFEERVKHENRV